MPIDNEEKPQGGVLLDVWLPGYHTPSLNVTKGHHWSQYYRLKKEAIKALLSAIDGLPASRLTPRILQARQRLSRMLLPRPSGKTSQMIPPSLSRSGTRKRK